METKRDGGALFKNDKKEKDTHPDYKGSITINGYDYRLSAWINESKEGKKYMSLSSTPKQTKEIAKEDLPF